MAQPKLSNATEQQILAIGPFDGLDATTDAYYVAGTYARDVLNFIPNQRYQGLAPVNGRIAGQYFTDSPITSLTIDYPASAPPTLIAMKANGQFVQQPFSPPNFWQVLPVPSFGGNVPTGKAGDFTSYGHWTYFSNQDVNALCYKFDNSLAATFWGIYQAGSPPQFALTSPSNGMIYGNAYYYRYTYAADNATDPGLSQESSPSPPAGPFNIGTPLGAPMSNGATVAQNAAPTVVANTTGGTMPDNTYFV